MTQEEYFIAGYEKLFGQKPPDYKLEQFRDHLKMMEVLKNAEEVRILHGRNRDYVMYLPKATVSTISQNEHFFYI